MTYHVPELDDDHTAVWWAIDRCAKRAGYTPSGLAVACGFHATTLNPSKRRQGDALRWPSTELIAAICLAANITWAEFGEMVVKELARLEAA